MDRDERRHLERGPDIRPASPHGSLATHCAAVSIEGCNTDQAGKTATVQLSELRQVGDEGRGNDLADTGNAGEQLSQL